MNPTTEIVKNLREMHDEHLIGFIVISSMIILFWRRMNKHIKELHLRFNGYNIDKGGTKHASGRDQEQQSVTTLHARKDDN
jgi:hypothetical protein